MLCTLAHDDAKLPINYPCVKRVVTQPPRIHAQHHGADCHRAAVNDFLPANAVSLISQQLCFGVDVCICDLIEQRVVSIADHKITAKHHAAIIKLSMIASPAINSKATVRKLELLRSTH